MTPAFGMVAIAVGSDPAHRLVATIGWQRAVDVVAAFREAMLDRLGEAVSVERRGYFDWIIVGPIDDPAVKELVAEMNSWVGATTITHDGEKFSLETRAGIASFDDLEDAGIADVAELKRMADTALCAALMRRQFAVAADTDFVAFSERRKTLSAQLLQSTPGDFLMNYQPIVELQTEGVAGFEALMRWNSPDGLRTPGDFLELLEETELIRSVGRTGIASTLELLKQGHADIAGERGFVTVNLAKSQLLSPDTSEVFHSFANEGVDMSRVWVELREDDIIGLDTPAGHVVEELHELGCRIAVDDLGKGYSALSYVKDLPVSVLKVDNRLIQEINRGEANMAVVQSITELADRMEMGTVAEGVECAEDIPVLKDLGFDYAQGYYFGYPAPAEVAFVIP